LGELTALPRPLGGFEGRFTARGGAGLGKRRERGRGRVGGEVEGRDLSEPCYATVFVACVSLCAMLTLLVLVTVIHC